VIIMPVLLLSPVSPVGRLLHPSQEDRDNSEARLIAWRAGAKMVLAEPVLGVGLGRFKSLMPLYSDSQQRVGLATMAHNTYVEIAAELGIPCLLVFLGILLFTYKSLARVRLRAEKLKFQGLQLSALGLQAGLVGYIVGATFLSAEYVKLFWLIVFCSISAEGMLSRMVKPPKRPHTPRLVELDYSNQSVLGGGQI
jgi:O-antigen ligase